MMSRVLRHFLATYERRNVTAAADDVCISQPALTRSLKGLEEKLGVQLFERLPGGMEPTPYGDLLAHYAKRIHNDCRQALLELDAARGGTAGQIRIGAGPIWIAHFLPASIKAFGEDWPNVRFSITQGTITTMMPALLSGEIDMFCGSLDFPAHPEIESTELLPIRHLVIASGAHPLAGVKNVRAEDLERYPWTFLAHDIVGRRQLGAFFAAAGLVPPHITLETSSIACALEAIASGQFLGCLAEPLLETRFGKGLVALNVERPIWHYRAGIARRLAVRSSVATSRFVEHLKSTVASTHAKLEASAASRSIQ
jgi:DNA-binding transcriptional LysR family regulator